MYQQSNARALPMQLQNLTLHQYSSGESDDDDVRDEVDGGITLDLRDNDTQFGGINSRDELGISLAVHQVPISEVNDLSNLWQLPTTPHNRNTDLHLSSYGTHDPTIAFYRKACGLIQRHWQLNVFYCVPEPMRKRTPYSLTLLHQLRRLASQTKQQYGTAKQLMLESYDARILHRRNLDGREMEIVETTVDSAYLISKEGFERTIQENLYGLTLEDVGYACQTLRSRKAEARQRKREQLIGGPTQGSQRKTRQAKIEAKVKITEEVTRGNIRIEKEEKTKAERKAEKLVAKAARKDCQLERSLAATADRVVKRRRARRSLQKAGVPSQEPADEVLNATANLRSYQSPEDSDTEMKVDYRPVSPNLAGINQEDDDEVVYKPTKRDRKRDKMLSDMANTINLNGRKDVKKSREKRLLDRGSLKNRDQPAPTPMERMDYRSVPPLSALGPNELARIGQLQLPR